MRYEDLYRMGYKYHAPIHSDQEVYTNGIDVIVVREQYPRAGLEVLGRWKESNPMYKVDYIQTILPFKEHVEEYIK